MKVKFAIDLTRLSLLYILIFRNPCRSLRDSGTPAYSMPMGCGYAKCKLHNKKNGLAYSRATNIYKVMANLNLKEYTFFDTPCIKIRHVYDFSL